MSSFCSEVVVVPSSSSSSLSASSEVVPAPPAVVEADLSDVVDAVVVAESKGVVDNTMDDTAAVVNATSRPLDQVLKLTPCTASGGDICTAELAAGVLVANSCPILLVLKLVPHCDASGTAVCTVELAPVVLALTGASSPAGAMKAESGGLSQMAPHSGRFGNAVRPQSLELVSKAALQN